MYFHMVVVKDLNFSHFDKLITSPQYLSVLYLALFVKVADFG